MRKKKTLKERGGAKKKNAGRIYCPAELINRTHKSIRLPCALKMVSLVFSITSCLLRNPRENPVICKKGSNRQSINSSSNKER